MNNEELTVNDLDFILVSLEYSKKNFRESKDIPYEERRKKQDRVDEIANKVRTLKKEGSCRKLGGM